MSKNLLKLFSAILVLSLLFIAACSSAPKTIPESSSSGTPITAKIATSSVEDNVEESVVATSTKKATETKQETTQTNTAESSSQIVTTSDIKVKEISMTARVWDFVPNLIEINKGDKVKLTVTAVDVKHGISIFGINKKLEPNKPEVIEFTADETGEFPFFCTVYCGDGHGSMKGKVIVR